MEAEYTYLWPMSEIRADWRVAVKRVVDWARENRHAFDAAAEQTRIPWWVIAGINNLEMGMNFNGTILNGDSWKSKTKHFPSGLGPWTSWLDACVWGFRYEAKGWGFDLSKYKWSVGGAFYFAESYNGHNVREEIGKDTVPPNASPYVYSGTQFYVSGKMQEVETAPGSGKYRGVFNKNLVSEQVGFMAFAKGLEQSGEKLF
jgi:lysozyme family protein